MEEERSLLGVKKLYKYCRGSNKRAERYLGQDRNMSCVRLLETCALIQQNRFFA